MGEDDFRVSTPPLDRIANDEGSLDERTGLAYAVDKSNAFGANQSTAQACKAPEHEVFEK